MTKITDESAYLKLSVLMFGLVASIGFLYFGPYLWGGIIGIAILVVIALFISKLELLHPFTWFVPIYFLYAVAVPLLVATGNRSDEGELQQVLFLGWVGLATFMVVVGNPKTKINISFKPLTNIRKMTWLMFLITFGLTSLYIAYFYASGMTSKYDLNSDDSLLRGVMPLTSIVIITFSMILARALLIQRKIPKKLLAVVGIYSFLALVVLGERDILLRIIICSLFLIHTLYYPVPRKWLLSLGALILVSIPFQGRIKNLFVQERVLTSDAGLLEQILSSEFQSASRNLGLILKGEENLWSFFYGETFWWDIKTGLLGIGQSTSAWFNQLFYPEYVARGAGRGFTLIGEGYLNFGVWGVILTFAVVALLIRYLYFKARSNVIWLIIYTVSVPTLLYLNRADFATLITYLTNHIVIPIFVIFLATRLITKKVYGKKNNYDQTSQ